MQKWEYCVVGPIRELDPWRGENPMLTFLTPNGKTTTPIENVWEGKKLLMKEDDVLAKTVAVLGLDGWELVGTGSIRESTRHYLYFKRPIP